MSFPCAGQEFLSSALLFAASPLGLLLWGTALWLLLGRRKRWLAAGLLVFLAACTPLGGKWALRAVESLCPPRSDQKPASVLVLSGGAVFDGVRFTASPASVRRLRFALQQTNGRPILLSGIESPLLLSWLSERKDLREVLIERSSRTTEENFRFSAPILRKMSGPTALVTDKFHMARAALWARFYAPDVQFVFAPVPSYAPPVRLPFDLLPSSKGLDYTTMALREALALLRDRLFIAFHRS